MQMNIMTAIVLIVAFLKMISGYKKGMVKELVSTITLIILCIVLGALAYGIRSYLDGQLISVVVAVIIIALFSVIHHFINVVLFPAKLLAKLPIIKFVDKLMGIILGVIEVVFILWAIYALLSVFDIGAIEDKIRMYTQENEILSWIYQNNYLLTWVNQLIAKIGV